MSIRKIDFIEGEYYHIYNRGNSKQKIFLDDKDRERFLKLLYLCNSKQGIDFNNDIVKRKIDVWNFKKGESVVKIGAWVLMPNHFHLYITPKTDALLPSGNAVTYFMHRVLTAYSKYFNAKYRRTGSLFESKFKSVHIKNDPQAKYLFSYIHLNPLKLIDSKWKERGIKDKKKTMEFLNSYKWSSYTDYLDSIRPESVILNRLDFLNYFTSKRSFQKEIFEWIKIKTEDENGRLASVFGSYPQMALK
ncbi:MAG: transposase [Patescibacteria group bacterium]